MEIHELFIFGVGFMLIGMIAYHQHLENKEIIAWLRDLTNKVLEEDNA